MDSFVSDSLLRQLFAEVAVAVSALSDIGSVFDEQDEDDEDDDDDDDDEEDNDDAKSVIVFEVSNWIGLCLFEISIFI